MKAVIQRVSRAEVRVNGKKISGINHGFLVLVGFTHDEDEESLRWTAHKLAGMRVFEDENDKMNLSIEEVGGEVLIVSQFTLYADVRKGRRPAFIDAAEPGKAEELYNRFCDLVSDEGILVKRGIFGAKMDVELVNDGPVTIIIEKAN
ncbi:D-tyrosyl-tRNA(Tyr) deacylase [bacterium]|nr:D-tyrosyl-tRNA(Tyr) deacylase [bacterium]